MTEERIKCALSTHPDIATLVIPLSALRIEGVFISFFLNPLCGEAGEWGGPAKRRPGESALYHDISQQSLFCLILGYYPSVGRELKVTLFYPKNMVYTVNRFL